MTLPLVRPRYACSHHEPELPAYARVKCAMAAGLSLHTSEPRVDLYQQWWRDPPPSIDYDTP